MQNFIKFAIIGSMSIVEFKNASFYYNNSSHKAIKNLNLIVEKGEFVTILGHNGSGKSTLAKLINGLLIPTSGEVLVNGLSTQDKKNLLSIRKTAGMVFQNPDNQAVATIVEDDVAFGPENLGLSRQEIKERIDFALKVTEMEEFRKKAFSNLSGGQKQRIAIAGILAMKPELIILDESTSMLDPKGRKEVLSIAKKLNKEEGITIILITHYMDEAVDSDKVVVLKQGEVLKSGTPLEIFKQEDILLSSGLSFPRPLLLSKQLISRGIKIDSCIKKEDLLSSLTSTLQKGNYSQEISSFANTVSMQEEVIASQNLTYTYNKKTKFPSVALKDVSLSVKQGEFIGVIGHTGSGKSTFIQHINRLIAVDEGSLQVKGYNLSPKKRKEKKLLKQNLNDLRKTVGMVFQYPENQLFGETVYFDVSFGVKNFMPKVNKSQTEEMVSLALQRVGLNFEEVKEKSPFELSGGQKRRVAIAGVIVTNPEILILDEPLAGLDPQGKIELISLLKNLFGKVCKTIILISHDMDEIASSCSRVIVFNNGEVAMDGKPQEVFSKVKELKDLRLDVPLVSYLVDNLKENGINISCDLTAEGFIDSIARGVKV